MSALGERTLVMLLNDSDSLDVLAREGLDRQVLPTESLRPVFDFAMKHYFSSGKAPTSAVLQQEFGDLFNEKNIDLDGDVDEAIEWAIDDLKAGFAQKRAHEFSIEMGKDLSEADTDEKVHVLADHSARLSQIVMSMMPRNHQIDLRYAATDLLDEYELAVANKGIISGLTFGMPQIDQYVRGVHDGELAIWGGGPKVGKSFLLDHIAYNEWVRERVGALFTLENSIPMTRMRIACQALHLNADDLYDGTLSAEDLDQLKTWVHDVLGKSDVPFLIFNPELHNRNPHAIVEMARAYNADSLIIDQLTFMDPTESKSQQTRTNDLREILHALKGLISTGRRQMPCVLAHQINREGVKAAEKTGRLSMYHMAESAEVERTADMAFGIYASEDAQVLGRAVIQLMAARRVKFPIDWDVAWEIARGLIHVRNQIDLSATEPATT